MWQVKLTQLNSVSKVMSHVTKWQFQLLGCKIGSRAAWHSESKVDTVVHDCSIEALTASPSHFGVKLYAGVLLCTIHQRSRAFGDCRQRHGGRLSVVESFVFICHICNAKALPWLYVQIVQATLLSLPLLWIPTPATK